MRPYQVYLSETHDPWANLAFESYLLEHSDPETPILFLWRNTPTVVIGRAQNPWLECHLDLMQHHQVKLARRISGGGAVYHDLGNMNFSFIDTPESFNKQKNLELIAITLLHLGIQAYSSGRNDLEILTPEPRKISGSAFRETKTRCLHHGTLLIHADLTALSQYLNPSPKKLQAKGVTSVRARVANLSEFSPHITPPLVQDQLLKTLSRTYDLKPLLVFDPTRLQAFPHPEFFQAQHLLFSSHHWLYGRTLPFTHEIHARHALGEIRLHMFIENQIIIDIEGYTDDLTPEPFLKFCDALKGQCYSRQALQALLMQAPGLSESLRGCLEGVLDQEVAEITAEQYGQTALPSSSGAI